MGSILFLVIAVFFYWSTRNKLIFYGFILFSILLALPVILSALMDKTPTSEEAPYIIRWSGVPTYYVNDYEIREGGIYFNDYWTSAGYFDNEKFLESGSVERR